MADSNVARARAGAKIFFLGTALSAALAVSGTFLAGCETVQLGPEQPAGTDTTKVGTATLTLINQRQTDPGPLVFMLYGPDVQDLDNVAPSYELDEVAFEKSLIAQVKPGRWKVAYRTRSGTLSPMPVAEGEGTEETWPVVEFAKGKSYTILIETDDGGITVWKYNVPIVD